MDFFGIGKAVIVSAKIYFLTSRCSGRTISMLESVKDGDRIVCSDGKESGRLRKLCREMKKNVDIITIPPNRPDELFEKGTSQGRTILDHSWVEAYYLNAIERAGNEIDHFERQSSGYGEPHRETKRKAIELAKFQI